LNEAAGLYEPVARALCCAWGAQEAPVDQVGITLTEVHATRRRRLTRHDHGGPFFCTLVSGTYEERAGGRTLRYAAGGTAFHPAALVHTDDLLAGSRLFGIQLGPAYEARLHDLGARPALRLHGAQADVGWLAARVRREWKRAEPCAALAVEGLVLEMLAAAARAQDGGRAARPPWVDRARDLLQAEFTRPVTVISLAAELGVHPARLARAFRRYHGRSIGTTVRALRVEAACGRLREEGVPLTDVAAETGFADQSHLTRVFKRLMGATPGAYRSLLARNR
jgi:AraC family transcriptional regulator